MSFNASSMVVGAKYSKFDGIICFPLESFSSQSSALLLDRLFDQFGHAELLVLVEKRRFGRPIWRLPQEGMAVAEQQPDEDFGHDATADGPEQYGGSIVFELLLRFGQDVEPEGRPSFERIAELGDGMISRRVFFGRFADAQFLVRDRFDSHPPRDILSRRQPQSQAAEQVPFRQRGDARGFRRRKLSQRIHERRVNLVSRLNPMNPQL